MSDVMDRAGHACELCEGKDDLAEYDVSPRAESIVVCATCRAEMNTAANPGHWRCLQGAIWSEVPAVQVVAVRVLRGLEGQSWATDLLDQVYLDEDTQDWADAVAAETVDCNGTRLADGDSVTLIKDLDVKGANFTAKRGTMVKNIRLGTDPGLVEGRVNKTSIYLKTEFIKKA